MHRVGDRISLAPTDLSNFLSCRHLSVQDLKVTGGLSVRPVRHGPVMEELQARGHAHETGYIEYLRAEGLTIKEFPADARAAAGVTETRAAMADGYDLLYQAPLADASWTGRADFLRRVESPSNLGSWSYEVLDTKLARETKAGTILQLCVYSHLVGSMQGTRPDYMHVVTPGTGFVPVPYRVDEYAAYFRLLEQGILKFLRDPGPTYPEQVSYCDYCVWWNSCEKRRRNDDALCYVAGIATHQIQSLRAVDIDRLDTLAQTTDVPSPDRGSREALLTVQEQARVQYVGRTQKRAYYELKEPFGPEHGLSLLPEPTPDDIFLDFEGSHFVEQGVQEYLTGYVIGGTFAYTAMWADTLRAEQDAFEQFVDYATAVRNRNPGAHIYHFAPYETAAWKRLMGRFATRERELDALLRAGAFVDLYRVVKQAMVAAVERYSIKDLEVFFGYGRDQDLRAATESRRAIEHAIEAGGIDETVAAHKQIVEDYNREDCESALRLRDWLERLRADAVEAGHQLERPVLDGGEASETVTALEETLRRLRDGILEGVPNSPEDRTPHEHARFILAHLMQFHRREAKAGYWEYFRLRDLDEDEYVGERRALAGLEHVREMRSGRAPLHRYTFPVQEIDARVGDTVYHNHGDRLGSVANVNYSDRTIDIKHAKATAEKRPAVVMFHSQVRTDVLQESLLRMGEAVLAGGLEASAPYTPGIELLLRESSPLIGPGTNLQGPKETTVEAACRLSLLLDGHVLAVQGPPGAGKTYAGGQVICALKRQGLRVGVTAVSHKVIVNLLESAKSAAHEQGLTLAAAHKHSGQYEGEWNIIRTDNYPKLRGQLADGTVDVVGATAWCWARPDFEQAVDVLIVDEAGQMTLGNVLAAAPAGKGLLLLGDPQQLEQPLQSSHPDGSEASALYHWLHGADTMPPDKGLFLGETWRLHPDIATFNSEIYYEGKLGARPELARQKVVCPSDTIPGLSGSGLKYVPAEHTGNQAKSPEEVTAVARIVNELLAGGSWHDMTGAIKRLTRDDVLVLAPYNAQVAALIEALPDMKDRIGTVDRFQGQEAQVVVYSMTSSSPDEAPRGMDFLYNRNRFNVATSRARALCILVGAPALFEPECRTVKQMKMANGFCRYLELASRVEMPRG